MRALAFLALIPVLIIASLWLEHRTATELPVPTGTYAVGRTVEDWADPQAKRELLVWIWYPAAAGGVTDDYLPRFYRISSRWLTRDLSNVRIHSLRNAAMSPRERSYPVVIMRAGASAEVWNYSTLAEDLASHGYVVVGFDAPYRTGLVVFPDDRGFKRTAENNPELWSEQERKKKAGALLDAWTADTMFVLDRLPQWNPGRLDLTRVGIWGHSFGGAVAAQFCHHDARCKAGIDLDGAPHGSVVQTGVGRPFLFLLSDHSGESGPEAAEIQANIQAMHSRVLVIRGANHFTFSDDGALLKSAVFRGALRLFGRLRIDGRRQLAITADCVHTFFDVQLQGAERSRLDDLARRYPEVRK